MELTIQDPTVTEERTQDEHDQVANPALQHVGVVPRPWDVLYQFGRMIWLGIAVTFGGTRSAAGNARGQQTELSCSPRGRETWTTFVPDNLAARTAKAI